MLQTRPQTDVCKPLMPDFMASKAQLQLCELSGPTFRFTTQEFSMVGGYTENPEDHKTLKSGGWGMGTCSGQYGTVRALVLPHPALTKVGHA